jgi:hypothetical protein
MEQIGNLLELTDEPEATQFRQSQGYWHQADSKGPDGALTLGRLARDHLHPVEVDK